MTVVFSMIGRVALTFVYLLVKRMNDSDVVGRQLKI
jgi:hypothetical protein